MDGWMFGNLFSLCTSSMDWARVRAFASSLSSRPFSRCAMEGVSVGLHLNLTEGAPLVQGLKTLVDAQGAFWGKMEARKKVFDVEELRLEISAQIELFVTRYGKLPTHVDGVVAVLFGCFLNGSMRRTSACPHVA